MVRAPGSQELKLCRKAGSGSWNEDGEEQTALIGCAVWDLESRYSPLSVTFPSNWKILFSNDYQSTKAPAQPARRQHLLNAHNMLLALLCADVEMTPPLTLARHLEKCSKWQVKKPVGREQQTTGSMPKVLAQKG